MSQVFIDGCIVDQIVEALSLAGAVLEAKTGLDPGDGRQDRGEKGPVDKGGIRLVDDEGTPCREEDLPPEHLRIQLADSLPAFLFVHGRAG